MTDDVTNQDPVAAAAAPAVASDSLIQPASTAALDFTQGKPEGFPDDFWDAEKKAPIVDKLFQAYNANTARMEGLRTKLAKGEFEGKPPEDIKEYVLELDEKLKDFVKDDDPMLNAAREAAKASGLPKEVFNKFISPVVAKLAELSAGQQEAEPTPEEIEASRMEEVAKLGPTGQRIVDAVASFISEMEAGGTLSKDEAAAARNMCNSADNARVLNKLRMSVAGHGDVPIEVPIDAKASRVDVEMKLAAAMTAGNEAEYNKYSAMLSRMNQ